MGGKIPLLCLRKKEQFTDERQMVQLKQKYATREMGRLGSGKIFDEILNIMRTHANADKPTKAAPKLMLLSAHDGTLLALLTALGISDFRTYPSLANRSASACSCSFPHLPSLFRNSSLCIPSRV